MDFNVTELCQTGNQLLFYTIAAMELTGSGGAAFNNVVIHQYAIKEYGYDSRWKPLAVSDDLRELIGTDDRDDKLTPPLLNQDDLGNLLDAGLSLRLPTEPA